MRVVPQEMVGEADQVRRRVDEVFDHALLLHPDLELQWLRLTAGSRAPQVGAGLPPALAIAWL